MGNPNDLENQTSESYKTNYEKSIEKWKNFLMEKRSSLITVLFGKKENG